METTNTLTEPSLLQMLAQRVPDEMALPLLESCLEVLGQPRKPVYTMDDVIAIGEVLTSAAAALLDEGLGILEAEAGKETEVVIQPVDAKERNTGRLL
ncbi:MAG: hypothetical protein FJY99_06230 [Candidatus Sericytochromatia bacterium]|nr:hypothetical protein [Candidatus Tanganyikabacteria bacterium]